jgi:hypothetical protein
LTSAGSETPARAGFLSRRWPVALFVLGAGAALWPWLGLPAGFASLIGVVALRRPSRSELPWASVWLWTGVALSSVGLVRFVSGEAMRGIVGGGRGAVEQETVSRLRDVLFAQDAMRRAGWIDPDRDGVGSAALLEELCGGPPLRGQPPRETPVLHCGELASTPLGPAARSGPYLYTLCLPTRAGGWSASAPRAGDPVDDEAAERRFIAFAWPSAESPFDHAFFIDEHENIRVASLPPALPGDRFPTTCAAALERPDWQPWRGKQPRSSLPGEPASEGPAR